MAPVAGPVAAEGGGAPLMTLGAVEAALLSGMVTPAAARMTSICLILALSCASESQTV